MKDLLAAIEAMKQEYPDWRIGQIVCNVACWKLGPQVSAAWDIEDQAFIDAVWEHLGKKDKKQN